MYQGTLEPVTNRQSWIQIIQVTDPDTGQLWNMSGYTVNFEVRKSGPNNTHADYVPWYDWGTSTNSPILQANTANDQATILSTGIIQISFTEAQMSTLPPMTYNCSCTISNGTDVAQLLLCKLPVLSGHIS